MASPDLIDEIIENSKIDTALETTVGCWGKCHPQEDESECDAGKSMET